MIIVVPAGYDKPLWDIEEEFNPIPAEGGGAI